jgi:Fic family protein
MADDLPEPLRAFESALEELSPELEQIDRLVVEHRDRKRAGRILPNVLEAIRVELTYHSNAIEGSTLSLRETQLVIEGKTPAGERPLREIYEARNHDRALRMIEGWVTDRPSGTLLSQRDVLEVHAQVMADIEPGSAGRFRSERVRIVGTGFIPPGAQKFDLLIPRLIDLANRPGIHPVLHAAELHYNLVTVHPFNDGNGRTARLMMNYHLLRRDFPQTIIDVNRRGEYLTALDEANAGKPARFARFIAQCVEASIRRVAGEST